ncbi:RNA-directed RNA polymerase [Colletotrichum kahawae]|uniref:RNA-directed RNA polymerase n=1 Tax=Colletotrichum kahawae TaxID=34407 RepID=A0AAE0D861_COLKA|nr:RNA-directed RNA polymerase [Colletotrichum kahawae]
MSRAFDDEKDDLANEGLFGAKTSLALFDDGDESSADNSNHLAGIQLQFIKPMAWRGQVPVSVVPSMYAALKPDGKFIHQAVSRAGEVIEPSIGVSDDAADDE